MRRFIEEIKVKDTNIAYRIAAALETRDANHIDPAYEVDMYATESFVEGVRDREARCVEATAIKIFIREDINQ